MQNHGAKLIFKSVRWVAIVWLLLVIAVDSLITTDYPIQIARMICPSFEESVQCVMSTLRGAVYRDYIWK